MKKTHFRRMLSLILSMVLLAAAALGTAGCGSAPADYSTRTYADGEAIGTGATTFTVTIVDGQGGVTTLTVSTDKETLGEALKELELIDGTEGDYGLYVKQINGITADYDADGTYWAFYVGQDYAKLGVDETKVTAGAEYRFQVQ